MIDKEKTRTSGIESGFFLVLLLVWCLGLFTVHWCWIGTLRFLGFFLKRNKICMGKQGPCCHCGITSTPLWRNGPPEKPVLCNACGSRWRTKGTLTNYTPLHARTLQASDSEGSHDSQEGRVPIKTKPENLCIKVHNEGDTEGGEIFAGYDLCPTGFEDDTSNRSSSGSAISCSESCVQLGSMNGNAISGSVQSSHWDSHIPSKKRSRIRHRSPSPFEKLRRDLFDILQGQESSYLSGSSEEVLIFERKDPTFSAEIGLGGVLLKPPISSEESEASSLVIQNKVSCINNTYIGSSCLSVQSQSSEINSNQEAKDGLIRDIGDVEELKVNPANQGSLTKKHLGDTLFSNPDILENKHSPPIQIKLKIPNNESFIPQNEFTSCSSRLVGGGISLPANIHPDPLYFPTSEGTRFDNNRGFKKPKERMVVQNSPSSSISAFFVGRNSTMTAVNVEPLGKDLQMRAHSEMSCPIGELPCPSPLQKEANLGEETKLAAETFQYPNLFVLSKKPNSRNINYAP